MSDERTPIDVDFVEVDPESADAQQGLDSYFRELADRLPSGFDLGQSLHNPAEVMRRPAGLFVVGRRDGEVVACGALKLHGAEPTELKRMWVAAATRGMGVGRRLLAELERLAAAEGSTVVQLDTNGALGEAIELYRSAGYREVPAFNAEPYADLWFEKRLGT